MYLRALLTGGTGFIGSHLLELLLMQKCVVRVLALPETVEQVRYANRVETIAGSLSDVGLLNKAACDVDVIFHLAGKMLGPSFRSVKEVNVNGTENLLRAAVNGKVKRFVFLSSVAVYRPAPFPTMWPVIEDYPREAHGYPELRTYAQSKIDAENLITQARRREGLEYVIIRSPVVYGPSPGIDNLLRQLIGDPQEALRRDLPFRYFQWVHVCDLVRGIVLGGSRASAANEVFNLPGPELFNVRDILAAVRTFDWRKQGIYSFSPLPNPRQHGGLLRYSFRKATKLLGYLPEICLREGISEVVTAMNRQAGCLSGSARCSSPAASAGHS